MDLCGACGHYFSFVSASYFTKVVRTDRTRAGLSPILGSKILRSPDIDRDTRSDCPLQVLPACWWPNPEPTVHVVTAFCVLASPEKVSVKTQYLAMRLTKFDCTVRRGRQELLAIWAPGTGHLPEVSARTTKRKRGRQ